MSRKGRGAAGGSRARGYESSDSSSEEDHHKKSANNAGKPSESLESVETAEKRIKENQFDLEAWGLLLLEARQRDKEYLDVYERVLKVFPTAPKYWRDYLEDEIKIGNHDLVNELFQRCLTKVPNVELWKMYLSYVAKTKESQPNEVQKAYEFATDYIGADLNSNQIWSDYVKFANNLEAKNEREREAKILLLRKIYSKACTHPVHGVEGLWREWERVEDQHMKGNSKLIIGEYIPKFMTSKAVYKERKALYEGINMMATPRPPRGNPKEERQLALWKRVLAYERSNPQRLDPVIHTARLSLAYNQALLCLYFYPAMWYEFAMWFSDQGQATEAIKIFNRALDACPDSLLLHFAYADFLEPTNARAAEDIYKKLLERRNDPIIWIQYMRFARRSLGTEAARGVFKQTRAKNVNAPHVVVASALMEFFYNKDEKVARNLFEYGLKNHSSDPTYVLQYSEFLTHLNDERNQRVLFEKALTSISGDAAKDVWKAYLDFEYSHGDLQTISKLEKRRQQSYPEIDILSGLPGMVSRYKFMDLLPCSHEELTALNVAAAPPRTTETQQADAAADRLASFPKPDLKSMVPLRPEFASMVHPRAAAANSANSSLSHNLHPELFSKGVPEQISRLLAQLPPASTKDVSILDVDTMLLLLTSVKMPDENASAVTTTALGAASATAAGGGGAAATTGTSATTTGKRSDSGRDGRESKKRQRRDGPNAGANPNDMEDSDSEEQKDGGDASRASGPRPPKDDLFLKRQAAKIRNKK